ncbi:unnamed protein product [Closterium sp. Naga37s-1]|nr:unnamed protein product [Closterium sp. Naga37s-1]
MGKHSSPLHPSPRVVLRPAPPLQADLKKRHYMVDNREQPSLNRLATMQTALHTVTRFTHSINYTGMPILLTYSPVHANVRINSSAPELSCSSYMQPLGPDALQGAQWATDALEARNAQIEAVAMWTVGLDTLQGAQWTTGAK